jgi:hypothetical protein
VVSKRLQAEPVRFSTDIRWRNEPAPIARPHVAQLARGSTLLPSLTGDHDMNTFFRSLIATLAVGFMAWTAPPVHAQSMDAATVTQLPAAWTQQFERQMVKLLHAPDAERPERAMQLIIHFAQMDDADGDPVFNFTSATPRLLDVYKRSTDQGQRLLALAALNAIDHEPALQELARTIRNERSDMVRQRAIHMLSARLQQQ